MEEDEDEEEEVGWEMVEAEAVGSSGLVGSVSGWLLESGKSEAVGEA